MAILTFSTDIPDNHPPFPCAPRCRVDYPHHKKSCLWKKTLLFMLP
jgi:hypothetical protein